MTNTIPNDVKEKAIKLAMNVLYDTKNSFEINDVICKALMAERERCIDIFQNYNTKVNNDFIVELMRG